MQHDRVLLLGVCEEIRACHLALNCLTECNLGSLIHYMLPTVNSLCRSICLLATPDKMRFLNCSELLLVLDAAVVSLHDNYVRVLCTADWSFRLLLLQGNCLFLIVLKHLIVRVYPAGVNSELWPTGRLHKL